MQIAISKHKVLSDMEKNLQGYGRSVKEVLQAAGRPDSNLSGIHGALAQLLSVPQKYTLAVEIAMGGMLQNIVTDNENDAKSAIEYLKKHNLGRATFLPISSVVGKRIEETTLGKLKGYAGFIGLASDLINYAKTYEDIARSLLGRVLIVENIDAAIKIAKDFKYSFKIVTLEGDILSPGGSMSGGSVITKESGILNRSNEIIELTGIIEKFKNSETKIQDNIFKIEAEIGDIVKEITDKERDSHEFEINIARNQSRLQEVKGNIAKIYARADMLTQEKERLIKGGLKGEEELKKYLCELEIVEKSIVELKQEALSHQDDHKDQQNERDVLQKEITDCKILVSAVTESIKNLGENIQRIKKESEILEQSIQDKHLDKKGSQQEALYSEEVNKNTTKLIDELRAKIHAQNMEMQEIVALKATIEEQAVEIVQNISELNKDLVNIQQELGKIEVKVVKTETELNMISDRMWDEYQITYSTALELHGEALVPNAQKEIARLRDELKRCGAVNLAAIDDYQKNKQRYEFMTEQRGDIDKSVTKLKSLIQELMATMKEQFMHQFELIDENFRQVFKELFDGGRASLVLSNSDNVLESGIEIQVQPPGKKLQNIMLLSGGEKAFTAIALLFAMLKLRPAPFCILDEIEGALDEVNV